MNFHVFYHQWQPRPPPPHTHTNRNIDSELAYLVSQSQRHLANIWPPLVDGFMFAKGKLQPLSGHDGVL